MIGYFILVGFFLTLVLLCFVPGLIEYRRPKDEGPLFIDFDRDLDERYFSRSFREMLWHALQDADQVELPSSSLAGLNKDTSVTRAEVTINRGREIVFTVTGDLRLPAQTELIETTVVTGNLETGNDCRFKKEVLVEGDAIIGENCRLLCLTGKNITLGENSIVEGWLDAEENLYVKAGCKVGSRASAEKKVVADLGAQLSRISAPELQVGVNGRPKKSITVIRAAHRRAFESQKKQEKAALSFLEKKDYWLQGAETVRVRGNVSIPDSGICPFNMIVEGDLTTGDDVSISGGVHVRGKIEIGERNYFAKSLVGEKSITIGKDSIVENCVDSEGFLRLMEGVRIGQGPDGGGISSGDVIYMEEGVLGHHKAYGEKGVLTTRAQALR